jgi:hypothetical protein
MDPLDFALMNGVGDAVQRVADDPVAPPYAGCLSVSTITSATRLLMS